MGLQAKLADVTDELNNSWLEFTIERISEWVPADATIAVLGLAYKPDTHVVEASAALRLVHQLIDEGYRVVAYDPRARETASVALGYRVVVQDCMDKTLQGADMVIVATPDPAFKRLNAISFAVCKPGVLVYDMWRLLEDRLADAPEIRYLAHGRRKPGGKDPLENLWR